MFLILIGILFIQSHYFEKRKTQVTLKSYFKKNHSTLNKHWQKFLALFIIFASILTTYLYYSSVKSIPKNTPKTLETVINDMRTPDNVVTCKLYRQSYISSELFINHLRNLFKKILNKEEVTEYNDFLKNCKNQLFLYAFQVRKTKLEGKRNDEEKKIKTNLYHAILPLLNPIFEKMPVLKNDGNFVINLIEALKEDFELVHPINYPKAPLVCVNVKIEEIVNNLKNACYYPIIVCNCIYYTMANLILFFKKFYEILLFIKKLPCYLPFNKVLAIIK